MKNSAVESWVGSFDRLSLSEQKTFSALVKEGGAIQGTPEQILSRLKRTTRVALLRSNESLEIAGVAALKSPTAHYRESKFVAAGVPLSGFEKAGELGYVVVDKGWRGQGLARQLVAALVSKLTVATFATTDSVAMQHILADAGFVRVGREWEGQRGILTLWTIKTA